MEKSKRDEIIGYVERSVPDICRKAALPMMKFVR